MRQLGEALRKIMDSDDFKLLLKRHPKHPFDQPPPKRLPRKIRKAQKMAMRRG
jgi:hypothetical protein